MIIIMDGLEPLDWDAGCEYNKPKFDKDDIIKMELDVSKKILNFYRNDEDINVQFSVNTSKIYRAAVSICIGEWNDDVKIVMIDSEFVP